MRKARLCLEWVFVLMLTNTVNVLAQGYKLTFPVNKYLNFEENNPVPKIANDIFIQLKAKKYHNIMDYGAKADGIAADDKAIMRAFADCKSGEGVYFPAGKTFVIGELLRIPVNGDLTILASDATFKMKSNGGYNAIAFESGKKGEFVGYKHTVIWLGGTLDGNKDNQSWPGSPTKNNNWDLTQGNYGFLTFRAVECAILKDVSLKNTVYDGVDFFNCKLSIIADCVASEGAKLNYSATRREFGSGRQATYFKITREYSGAAYFLNVNCKDGSIGIHYSTRKAPANSLAVVSECSFVNQSQDAMHFEHCRNVVINKSTVKIDKKGLHGDVHISNACEFAAIQNSIFENSRLDFRNSIALKKGQIKFCEFKSTGLVSTFIEGATHVENCTFNGATTREQVRAKYIYKCKFENFKTALAQPAMVVESQFLRGGTAIQSSAAKMVLHKVNFEELNKAIEVTGNSKKSTNVLLNESVFQNIQSNAVDAVRIDSLVIQNSVFRNFGLNSKLSQEERLGISIRGSKKAGDPDTKAQILNSVFSKKVAGASTAPFEMRNNPGLTANNSFEGLPAKANNSNRSRVTLETTKMLSFPNSKIAVVDENGKKLGDF